MPIVPFLCLSAAWTVTSLVDRVFPARSTSSARRAAVTVAASALLIWPSAVRVWQVDRLLDRDDNRVVLARWFAEHVPAGSSVVQSGSQYGHAQFDPRAPYVQWIWNRNSRLFEVDGREATGRPDWIVIQESPLPSETQPILRQFLQEDYALVRRFDALTLPGARVYDTQDAFFLPLTGFDGIRRPGPNFTVYQRRGAPYR